MTLFIADYLFVGALLGLFTVEIYQSILWRIA